MRGVCVYPSYTFFMFKNHIYIYFIPISVEDNRASEKKWETIFVFTVRGGLNIVLYNIVMWQSGMDATGGRFSL